MADIVPNLAIGLRAGLDAGLVVSILLAAIHQAARADAAGGAVAAGPNGRGRGHRLDGLAGTPTAPVWLGVLAAATLAGCFAAVVTYATDVLPGQAEAVAAGLLSVLAAGLFTVVISWLRGAPAGLVADSRGGALRTPAIGAGVLMLTAFLAVGHQGLAAALVLRAAARAAGGPFAGTVAGLALAALLCLVLYWRALRLAANAFFTGAAIALLVIAAGVLAQGLGQLQVAGLLSGQRWLVFDLTAHVHPGTWWVALITGVTGLAPKMTVLQVIAWVCYFAVTIPAFARAGRRVGPAGAGVADPAGTGAAGGSRHRSTRAGAPAPGSARRWGQLARRRPWAVAAILVLVPALAAAGAIAALPSRASATTTVTVTRTSCASGWTAAAPGTTTFTVENQSGLPGEINFDDASGDIVAEIETLGPATSAQLNATLSGGTYVFECFMGALPAMASRPVQVPGAGGRAAGSSRSRPVTSGPAAINPVSVSALAGPNRQYQAYATGQLTGLARSAARIEADLRRDDLGAARSDWLSAQLDWERVGASYDSFGDLGLAVDGLPAGLPGGVSDPHFTGLHRLEYGLWHGQSAASLIPVAASLAANVALVRKHLTASGVAGDPANLPVRAHEILEDALRDHLSGQDDEGGGAAFAQTYADVQVTRAVLSYLTPLLDARQPGLPDIADGELADLQQALLATRVSGQWVPLTRVPAAARERVDAAIGAVLEALAPVPDLLEVPPTR
jgi:high-affinity iron transporter